MILITITIKITYTSFKTVSLQPVNENESGAFVEKLSSNEVSQSDNQWTISPVPVNKQGGWIIGLHMDNTWGFNSSYPSQITIDIIGNNSSPDPSDQFDHLIFSFAINSTQYWSVGLRMDNSAMNQMYPGIVNGTNIAYGDIYQMFISGASKERWFKAVGPGSWQNMVPQPAEMLDLNQWNLKFIIYNDPTKNNAIFQYTNTFMATIRQSQGKNFSNLIENEGLDVYITSDDSGKSLTISEFKITYDIITAPMATNTPTEHPSSPSQTSNEPSTSPSSHPSVSPLPPSISYVTTEPTSNPSSAPTNKPSVHPTTTANSTVSPSQTSTTGIFNSGENNDITTSEVNNDNNSGKKTLSTLVIVIIAVAILCILGVTFILYKLSRPKRPISKLAFVGMNSNSILPMVGTGTTSPTQTDGRDVELVTKMQIGIGLESGGPHDDVPDTRDIDLDFDMQNDIEIIGDSDEDIMTPKGTIDNEDEQKHDDKDKNDFMFDNGSEEVIGDSGDIIIATKGGSIALPLEIVEGNTKEEGNEVTTTNTIDENINTKGGEEDVEL
eukprot:CAMPEP_0201575982 /NCGR_PEP_ID=MMETSP0190_2-20130828/21495_1 /ASSEMBLY_ACC=CAM_ASM_000263 /TAXON_ID=37353 /ORGANISM="Rosalina sp." /LENGTH=552 /DNA_ID=CAMNT_0048006293 /DNA_START=50 /DNA_END=1708 /DNA_ORIENTATION=+